MNWKEIKKRIGGRRGRSALAVELNLINVKLAVALCACVGVRRREAAVRRLEALTKAPRKRPEVHSVSLCFTYKHQLPLYTHLSASEHSLSTTKLSVVLEFSPLSLFYRMDASSSFKYFTFSNATFHTEITRFIHLFWTFQLAPTYFFI